MGVCLSIFRAHNGRAACVACTDNVLNSESRAQLLRSHMYQERERGPHQHRRLASLYASHHSFF